MLDKAKAIALASLMVVPSGACHLGGRSTSPVGLPAYPGSPLATRLDSPRDPTDREYERRKNRLPGDASIEIRAASAA